MGKYRASILLCFESVNKRRSGVKETPPPLIYFFLQSPIRSLLKILTLQRRNSRAAHVGYVKNEPTSFPPFLRFRNVQGKNLKDVQEKHQFSKPFSGSKLSVCILLQDCIHYITRNTLKPSTTAKPNRTTITRDQYNSAAIKTLKMSYFSLSKLKSICNVYQLLTCLYTKQELRPIHEVN